MSDEDGDENYKTMSSASPSKGLPKFHNTDQPVALIADRHHHHHSNYEVPRNLSQLPIIEMAEDESKWVSDFGLVLQAENFETKAYRRQFIIFLEKPLIS